MTKENDVKETETKIEKDTKNVKSKVSAAAGKAVDFVRRHKTAFVEGAVIAGVVGVSLYLNRENTAQNANDYMEALEDAAENDTDDSAPTHHKVNFQIHLDPETESDES